MDEHRQATISVPVASMGSTTNTLEPSENFSGNLKYKIIKVEP